MNNLELKLRLTAPDMYGFCGRDNHPGPEMVGEVLTVLTMTRVSSETGMPEETGDLQFFHCLRAPGTTARPNQSLVDVFDFEVELVSAEPVQ